MRTALFFFLGLALGVVTGGYIQQNVVPKSVPINQYLILTIPKNDREAERQLLYMAASKGMLEEIHRQGVLKRK